MHNLSIHDLAWLAEVLPQRIGAADAELDLRTGITPLPFYEGGLLVRLRQGRATTDILLIGDGEVREREIFCLYGNSATIHAVNENWGVTINEDTVLDYLRFFCGQISDRKGRFPIVENQTFPVEWGFLAVDALRIINRFNGEFVCQGYTMHAGHIFCCVFRVTPEGFVEMLDDDGGRGPVIGITPRPKVYA